MSWSYSGDPSTSQVDAVRFLIGDTDTNDQLLTDEEIAYLLTGNANPAMAAFKAARAIAASFAKKRDKTVGSLSIKYGQRFDQYMAFSKELYKTAMSDAGGVPLLGGGGRTYLGGSWL